MRKDRISLVLEKQAREHEEAVETINEIIALTEIEGQNSKATITELAEHLKDMMPGEEKTK